MIFVVNLKLQNDKAEATISPFFIIISRITKQLASNRSQTSPTGRALMRPSRSSSLQSGDHEDHGQDHHGHDDNGDHEGHDHEHSGDRNDHGNDNFREPGRPS